MFSDLNYWAILVSGVIYWVIGGVWYAGVFGKAYQAALGFEGEEKAKAQKDFPKALLAHFVSGLLTSVVLATVLRLVPAATFGSGMWWGFWLWVGFALTQNLNFFTFERRPAPLFALNLGFFLLAFLVCGGLLAVWR